MERERAKLRNESRVETSDANAESLRQLRLHDRSTTNSNLLPIDLLMEILKRLPVKTLARFLCVSKLWASIIRRRDFMKLFLTSIRPNRLFFTFRGDDDCFFFSSLQTQKPGEASLATFHMTYPAYEYTINYSFVHGLVCYGNASASGLVVYNPTTRRSIALPEFERDSFVIRHFLGYDPIDGVYKVFCLTGPRLVLQMAEPKFVSQVLTLGNENDNSWKTIEFSRSHFPLMNHICIGGLLYFEACSDTECKEALVMSFDVRSEIFDLIKRPADALSVLDSYSTMIMFEGKLAFISKEILANGSIVLWVLEDVVKHEWLKKTYVLPDSWTSLAQGTTTSSHQLHRFFNVTDAGELILAPVFLCVPTFYVLYYDPKRKSVRKVEIEGVTEHKLLHTLQACLPIYLFSSQVESLMFL